MTSLCGRRTCSTWLAPVRDVRCAHELACSLLTFLRLGTEYHLSIYDTTSSQPLQTLSYTTYSSSTLPHASPMTSNNTDYPSQATWVRTPDSLYLQPMHDGSLVCFRAGRPGIFWTIDFAAPIVSVFDVVVPTAGPGAPSADGAAAGLGGDERHPIMFEQPHPLLVPDLPLDFALLQREPAATFVGRLALPADSARGRNGGGELFAMSRDRFPLVPFAQVAEVAQTPSHSPTDADASRDESGSEDAGATRPPCRGLECLIGRHKLLNPPPPSPIGIGATLDSGSPEPLLLEGAEGEASATRDATLPSDGAAPTARSTGSVLARAYRASVRELQGQGDAGGGRLAFSVLVVVLAAWWWTKYRKASPAEASDSRVGDAKMSETGGASQARNDEPRVANGADSTGRRKRSPSTPPTPTEPTRPHGLRRRSSSTSVLPAVPISTVSKELPPLPPAVPSIAGGTELGAQVDSTQAARANGAADGDEGESDSGALDGPVGPGTPPRKRNRRRRGAKKKKPKDGVPGLADELGDDRELLEGIALSERETRDEDGEPNMQVDAAGRGVDGEKVNASAPQSATKANGSAAAALLDGAVATETQLGGGLSVSETILGTLNRDTTAAYW